LLKFGSYSNREKYRRALNWFHEGGAADFKPPDGGGEEEPADGKKGKKGKKKK